MSIRRNYDLVCIIFYITNRAAYLCATVVVIIITCHINKDYPASSAIGRHIDIGTCLLVKYTCRVFQNR